MKVRSRKKRIENIVKCPNMKRQVRLILLFLQRPLFLMCPAKRIVCILGIVPSRLLKGMPLVLVRCEWLPFERYCCV